MNTVSRRALCLGTSLLALLLLSASAALGTELTFTNAGGDRLWSNPANWSPQQVPGPQDTVLLAGPDVLIPGSVSVQNLTLSAGSLQGAAGTTDLTLTIGGHLQMLGGQLVGGWFDGAAYHGSLTLAGAGAGQFFTWSGGTLFNKFTVAPSLSVVISGPGLKMMQNVTLDNYGSIDVQASLVPQSSSLFNHQDANLAFNGAGRAADVFEIADLARGRAARAVDFVTNQGVVTVKGSWHFTGLNYKAVFPGETRLEGGTLDLGSGDIDIGGSTFDGDGTIRCHAFKIDLDLLRGQLVVRQGSTLHLQADLLSNVSGQIFVFSGATANLAVTNLSNAGTAEITNAGGSLTIGKGGSSGSGVLNASDATIDSQGGTLAIDGFLSNAGQLAVAGGTLVVSGTTTNRLGGTIAVDAGAKLTTSILDNQQGTVEVAGTLETTLAAGRPASVDGPQLARASGARDAGRGSSCGVTGPDSVLNSGDINVLTGGNLVGLNGSNIVALGGGNLVGLNGSNIVANGGGNIVANGGGNLVGLNGSNIVANGGGNIVANGGGNRGSGGVLTAYNGSTWQGNTLCSDAGSTVTIEAGSQLTFNLFEILSSLWRFVTGGRAAGVAQLTGQLHNGGRMLVDGGVTIQLTGNFIQEPAGILEVGAGGGTVEVSGSAALDGTLQLSGVSGSFDVLHSASRSGDFVISGLSQPGGACFQPSYGAGGLALQSVDCAAASTTVIEGFAFLAGQADHSGIQVSLTLGQNVSLPHSWLTLAMLAAGAGSLALRGKRCRTQRRLASALALLLATTAVAGALATATTTPNGRYRFENSAGFAPGDYLLVFQRPGHAATQVAVKVEQASSVSVAAATTTLQPARASRPR